MNPVAIRIDISVQPEIKHGISFDEYVDSLNWDGLKVLSIGTGEALENGLQTYKVIVQAGSGNFSYSYVTDGDRVFAVVAATEKEYIFIQDLIIKRFALY